jgi:protein-histidine pros-kinase
MTQFIGILEPDGTIIEINQAALQVRALQRAQVIGELLWEIPWWERSPEGRARVRDSVATAAAGRAVRYQIELLATDETIRTFDFSLKPVIDQTARVSMIVLEGWDITERSKVELEQARLLRQAEAAEAKFRTLVESAPDAIIMTQSDGVILLVNRQSEVLFGYQRDELLGASVEVLVPERFRAAHVDHRAHYNRDPRTRPMGQGLELSARRKDGSEVPVAISLSPVQDGDATLTMSIVRDITDQRSLERQKDEFLGNVSHDLRTPLAAIKASIGVVLANEPSGTPEPLHRMFANIDLAADRMAKLVADLLDLTRLQAGRTQLRLNRCDLRALAQRCLRAIEPVAEARAQRIQADLPPEPLETLADLERLERALLNVLGNAQKYGRTAGIIQVKLERRDGTARIAVTDDGPGIPAADRDRIFERFYRPEAESTRRNEGSGLGLPIARAMIELHGGRIWLDSAPSAGTTFWIELPLVDPGVVQAEDGYR